MKTICSFHTGLYEFFFTLVRPCEEEEKTIRREGGGDNIRQKQVGLEFWKMPMEQQHMSLEADFTLNP